MCFLVPSSKTPVSECAIWLPLAHDVAACMQARNAALPQNLYPCVAFMNALCKKWSGPAGLVPNACHVHGAQCRTCNERRMTARPLGSVLSPCNSSHNLSSWRFPGGPRCACLRATPQLLCEAVCLCEQLLGLLRVLQACATCAWAPWHFQLMLVPLTNGHGTRRKPPVRPTHPTRPGTACSP